MDDLLFSVLFLPWHKLAEFQWTVLYQILLCCIHSLSLSIRMKITVSSRFKPAHIGAPCVLSFRVRALAWMAGECICCAPLPVAHYVVSAWVSETQLVSTAWALIHLRVQNPDGITPISVRTMCYHLRLWDSAPWWRCLSSLTGRGELESLKVKKDFFSPC